MGRDDFNENSAINPVEQFCLLRNKWLVDGESISRHELTNSRYYVWVYSSYVELWNCSKQECHHTQQSTMVCRE